MSEFNHFQYNGTCTIYLYGDSVYGIQTCTLSLQFNKWGHFVSMTVLKFYSLKCWTSIYIFSHGAKLKSASLAAVNVHYHTYCKALINITSRPQESLAQYKERAWELCIPHYAQTVLVEPSCVSPHLLEVVLYKYHNYNSELTIIPTSRSV